MNTCSNKLKCALRERTCCLSELGSMMKPMDPDSMQEVLDVKCVMDKNETGLPHLEGYSDTYEHKRFFIIPSNKGVIITDIRGNISEVTIDGIEDFFEQYCPILAKECKHSIGQIAQVMGYKHKRLAWEIQCRERSCIPQFNIVENEYLDKNQILFIR